MMLSSLLVAFVAANVILAGAILWRVVRRPPVRWVIGGLTLYGAIAFAHAVASGATLQEALRGKGLFQFLPLVLRGAVVGAFLILPLGWIASIVRAGIPRFRGARPRRAFYRAVALTTCVVVVAASIPHVATPPSAAGSHGTSAAGVDARLAQLNNSLRAIEDGERESSRDRWDPDYVVQMVGRDPQRLFEWVRDETAWIPYRGVLRGAVGVLMDRQGNSLDRALLLATLLQRAGHSVRLAHGVLARDQAVALLPKLVAIAAPSAFSSKRRSRAAVRSGALTDVALDLERTAAAYDLDARAVDATLVAQARSLEALRTDLNSRVAAQTRRLLDTVATVRPRGDWPARIDAAVDALRDHWWVQWRDTGEWRSVDLLAADDSTRPETPHVQTMDITDIAPDLRQTIDIRVIAERWSGGSLHENRIVDETLSAAEVSGERVVLQFWPGAWPTQIQQDPDGPYGVKASALEQDEWQAVLTAGSRAAVRGVISDRAGEPAAANPFAGLARAAAARELPGSSRTHALTAVWIEYELRIPGEAPTLVRRRVFDLLGPAARAEGRGPALPFTASQRLTRSLALMMRTEILPVACRLAPEFVAHVAAQSMLADRDVFATLAAPHSDRGTRASAEVMSRAIAPMAPLLTLALTRWGTDASPSHVFIDRPNILTRHVSLGMSGQSLALVSAFDIVANGVGVDLVAPDAFAARVTQGVLDTNAEAMVGPDRGAGNVADAFMVPGEWQTIIDRGYLAVSPVTPGRTGDVAFTGWWQIEPDTGVTLGIGANGWGAGPEDSLLLRTAVEAAKGFTFEYGLCQFTPQAVNFFKIVNDRYFGQWHPSWAGVAHSEDPTKVAADNNRTCLLLAIASGLAATVPLLVLTIKIRQMRNTVRLMEEIAAEEAEAQALMKRLENDELLKLPDVRPTPTIVDPGNEAAVRMTQVPRVAPGLRTDPAVLLEKERAIQAAETNYARRSKELSESVGELVRYRWARRTNPTYDLEVEEAMANRVDQEFADLTQAGEELKRLDPGRGFSRPPESGGPPKPPPPPPPQPKGNNNLTEPAIKVAVGAAGADGALEGGGQ
jgi:hypothetical protein